MSPQAPNHRGRMVADRYLLGPIIGEGGFGRGENAVILDEPTEAQSRVLDECLDQSSS